MENLVLEMTIDDILVGEQSRTGFVPVTLSTNRGEILCRYYHIPGEKKAVIFVGGIKGGFDTPARNLYPQLCQNLTLKKISALRMQYRCPDDLVESSLDVLACITFLERFGIEEIALVGHSFGGAVVIQAAAAAPEIVTNVITLATQTDGAEAATHLHDTSLLLIHGTKDTIFPSASSTYIHDLATGPKELLLVDGADHTFTGASKKIYEVVEEWLTTKMSSSVLKRE